MAKITVRNSVWETNSSTVHTLVVLPEDEMKKWKNDGLIKIKYDYRDPIHRAEVIAKDDVDDFIRKMIADASIDNRTDYHLDDFRTYFKQEDAEWDDGCGESYIDEYLEENDCYTYEHFANDEYKEYSETTWEFDGKRFNTICKYGYE